LANKIIKTIFNALGIFLVSILVLFLALFFIIQQPSVQTWMVHKATTILSEKTGTEVSVERVNIKFFKTISLENIFVEDIQGDTLAYIRNLDARMSYFNPFKIKFYFNSLTLDGVRANVYRAEGDSTFNYQFLADAFKGQPKPVKNTDPGKKKTANMVDIRIKDIHLSDIAVIFDDREGGQGHNARLASLDISVKDIDLNAKILHVNSINLVAPDYTLTQYKSSEDTTAGEPFKVNIGWMMDAGTLKISDGHFGIHNASKERPKVKPGFEFNWFDVENINLDAQDFRWDSLLTVNVRSLTALSPENDVNLKTLKGIATMHDTYIDAQRLHVAYNNSSVKGSARLSFDSFADFGEFIDKVYINGEIEEIKANGHDVGVWAKVAQQYVPDAVISGKFKGTISDFKADDIYIKAGSTTLVEGSAAIRGIPDPDKMFIDADISRLQTHSTEIKKLVPYIKLPQELDLAGSIVARGSFKGKIKDFDTDLNLKTDVGNLVANVHLAFPNRQPPVYKGSVRSTGINLNALTKVEKLNNVAFDLNINGRGFSLADINSSVSGEITGFDYNYYRYDKITLQGKFEQKKFEGHVQMMDECAEVEFSGMVDLNDTELPVYNFYAKVNNADLQELNFLTTKLVVNMEGNFEFEGKDINNLTGKANLTNINFIDNQYNVDLSDLQICLEKIGEYKEYTIESADIYGYMKGYFDPIKLPASLQYYLSKHTTLLNAPGIEKLEDLMFDQDLEMNITVSKDIGLASLLDPKIKSFSDINITGVYNSEHGKINLDLLIDSLIYDNIRFNKFKTNIFDRNDSLIITSSLGSVDIGNTRVNSIRLGATTNLSGFYSRFRVESDTAKNNLELITAVNFRNDTVNIRFPRSRIKINNKEWSIDPSNNIVIVDSIFKLNNFTLQQNEQKITIANRQNLSDAFIKIQNLDIADLAQILDSSGTIIKRGFLDANIRLKNALRSPEIDGDISLNKFKVYDLDIDLINLDAKLSDSDKSLLVGGFIEDDEFDVQLNGRYSLDKNNKSPLDINVDFNKLNLSFLAFPIILGNEISNLHAFAKGKIKVGGSFNQIALDGKATIIDTASVKVNFLGTTFKFVNEDVVLKPRSIEFYKGGLLDKSITLLDEFGNRATLQAKLEHNSFNDFAVQATIITDKFNFLKTTYNDNKDFFGKVFASGSVDISGPVNNINMDINARTLPGTEFNIVVAGTSGDQLYDFVKFVDRSKRTDSSGTVKTPIKTSGINLNMNINATQDAQLKMYLDYSKNDVIRARGNGELKLNIGTNGMQMYGNYVATSGDYLFSQQEVVNKKFSIRNGSTVSWSGNIMDAKMDVDAVYSARVSMNDVVDSTSNLRNRRFPVDVVLKIGGTLASTDINFELEPTPGPNTPDELTAVIDRINQDKNQVNTQAFGLILFNRFLNLQGNTNGQQTGSNIGVDLAVTTLTEFFNAKISEYVNEALGMLLPGTEVAISQGTDNTGIRVTRKLNNERLIINLGGDVQYGTRERVQLQESNTGFVGDVEIQYLITEDGRVSAKIYSRYDNTIIRLENESYLRSGIGITYQKEVDKFFQLFRRESNRRKKKQPPLPAGLPAPEPDSNATDIKLDNDIMIP